MLCSAAGEKSVSLQCVPVHGMCVCVCLSHSPSASVSQQRRVGGLRPYTALRKLKSEHGRGEEDVGVSASSLEEVPFPKW